MLYQIKKNTNNEKIPVGLTGGIGAGLPIGTLISLEDESNVPEGFLKCDGSAFDATQYPALALYLGGNTLPYEADHSKAMSEFTDVTSSVGNTEATAFEMPYDGSITLTGSGWERNYCWVAICTDGVWYNRNFAGSYDTAAAYGGTALQMNKGDKIYTSANNSSRSKAVSVRYYKSCKFIKAVSGIEEGTTEAAEVANAVNSVEASFDSKFDTIKAELAAMLRVKEQYLLTHC